MSFLGVFLIPLSDNISRYYLAKEIFYWKVYSKQILSNRNL